MFIWLLEKDALLQGAHMYFVALAKANLPISCTNHITNRLAVQPVLRKFSEGGFFTGPALHSFCEGGLPFAEEPAWNLASFVPCLDLL